MQVTAKVEGNDTTCVVGTPVGTLRKHAACDDELPCIAAMVNNDAASLSYPLAVNSTIHFLTTADPHGWRIYRRSLCFLLAKAVRDLHPEATFRIEHSFGPGLYCSFREAGADADGISEAQLEDITDHLRDVIDRDLPIERRKLSYTDAVSQFEAQEQVDKLNLLRHRNPPHVVVHWCDGFSDLAHGPLAPATGVLEHFELLRYEPGFVLQLPERQNPRTVPAFEDQPHLFTIFQEHKEWGRIIGVNTAGRLNERIAAGETPHLIRTVEALHEKKLGRIADHIAAARDRLKLILIAGPSCAGKTTFAKRLSTHLRVNGLRPVTLATDDYFVGDDRNPVDEEGDPDYEHIEAVDLERFNSDLVTLIEGGTIEVRHFNFTTKQPEYHGDTFSIAPDEVLLIEGIHGLNPRLTEQVPPDREFKIYVNALTQLSVDTNNRISTTDNRLMRRIVRDHKYRNHSTLETLQMWPSVRRGEKRWIFPFQREAHATFNSALDYELAVLKPFVEPLLMQVKSAAPEYAEARRLSEFLLNFVGTSPAAVPGTSILREYIGESNFDY